MYDLTSRKAVSCADDNSGFYREKTWANLENEVENDYGSMISLFQSKYPTSNIEETKFVIFNISNHILPKNDKLKIGKQDEETEIYPTNNIKC